MNQVIYTRFDELQDQLLDIEEDMEFYGETEELLQEHRRILECFQAWQLAEPQKDKWLRQLRDILLEIQSQERQFGEDTGSYYEYLRLQRDDLIMQIQMEP